MNLWLVAQHPASRTFERFDLKEKLDVCLTFEILYPNCRMDNLHSANLVRFWLHKLFLGGPYNLDEETTDFPSQRMLNRTLVAELIDVVALFYDFSGFEICVALHLKESLPGFYANSRQAYQGRHPMFHVQMMAPYNKSHFGWRPFRRRGSTAPDSGRVGYDHLIFSLLSFPWPCSSFAKREWPYHSMLA